MAEQGTESAKCEPGISVFRITPEFLTGIPEEHHAYLKAVQKDLDWSKKAIRKRQAKERQLQTNIRELAQALQEVTIAFAKEKSDNRRMNEYIEQIGD